MSDETVQDDHNDIPSSASKADLKAAADDILKKAKANAANDPASEMDEPMQDERPMTPDQTIMILEAEKDELREQLLRSLAEAENLRKRSEREKLEARTYSIEKFAADLLSVSDNLARALDALPAEERENFSEAGKNLLGGIEMTAKELETVLSRNGVKLIEAEPGGAFDPNKHQAVANVPSEHPAGSIASLFQAGWQIGDRTLRAAMVAVSAGPSN